jgi:hypothetical protein
MIKVTITSAETRQMKGVGKTSQKPYNLHFQTVWAHTLAKDGKPNPFPEKVEIILDKREDETPIVYAPGEYVLHPASIYVDRQGNFGVAPKLVPAKS